MAIEINLLGGGKTSPSRTNRSLSFRNRQQPPSLLCNSYERVPTPLSTFPELDHPAGIERGNDFQFSFIPSHHHRVVLMARSEGDDDDRESIFCRFIAASVGRMNRGCGCGSAVSWMRGMLCLCVQTRTPGKEVFYFYWMFNTLLCRRRRRRHLRWWCRLWRYGWGTSTEEVEN